MFWGFLLRPQTDCSQQSRLQFYNLITVVNLRMMNFKERKDLLSVAVNNLLSLILSNNSQNNNYLTEHTKPVGWLSTSKHTFSINKCFC